MSLVNKGALLSDVAAGLGVLPVKTMPWVETDNAAGLAEIWRSQGAWALLTRQARHPGFYQRSTQYHTNSLFQHSAFVIGHTLGTVTRKIHPTVLIKKKSHRWDPPPGHPHPMIEGIPKEPRHLEVIESRATVGINDLHGMVEGGEQVIAFTDPAWTAMQRVSMAREAYSWFGEPYDVLEIAKRIFWWIPNPAGSVVCSTLLAQIILSGDRRIVAWCQWRGLDIGYLTPGDMFRFCVDMLPRAVCFNCRLEDAIAIEKQ